MVAMIKYFQRLFSYDDWANRDVLSALQALPVAAAVGKVAGAHSFRQEIVV